MTINDFLGIAIVGVVLSIIIEGIKSKYGPTSGTTKILTVVLALVFGAAYVLIQGTIWWTTILAILGAASTVYAFFFK